jgi:hypothetical protein
MLSAVTVLRKQVVFVRSVKRVIRPLKRPPWVWCISVLTGEGGKMGGREGKVGEGGGREVRWEGEGGR